MLGGETGRKDMDCGQDREVGSATWCDPSELQRVRADDVTSLLQRAVVWKESKCEQLKEAIGRCDDAKTVPQSSNHILGRLKLEFDSSSNALKKIWDGLVAEEAKDIDLVEKKRQEVLQVETAIRLNSILCSLKLGAWNDAKRSCKSALERATVAQGSEQDISRKVKLLFRLGKASAKLGEFKEAKEALLEALKLDPSMRVAVASELKQVEHLREKYHSVQRTSYGQIFGSEEEMYDESERAPRGQAYPAYRDKDMSRGLDRVDYEEEFREIDEEEQALQRRQEAMGRMRTVDMTYKGNPWDPSGERQQREIDDYYLKMFADQEQGS